MLAEITRASVLVGFDSRSTFYTGISNLFANPEFTDYNFVQSVSAVVDRLDSAMDIFFDRQPDEIEVLVGSRNPLHESCSMVVGKMRNGFVFSLFGPMRMNYQKNYSILVFYRSIMSDEKKSNVPSKEPKVPETKENAMDQLEKQCQEYLDGWKRAKADYANLKREADERQREIGEYARILLLHELVPIFDHFKEAFNHLSQEDMGKEWVIGISHIKKQFADFLMGHGVEEIPTVGQVFNPLLHEAVGEEHVVGVQSGTILKECRGGYQYQKKTIIPAKVIVAGEETKS
jgi:molecular chaperone GrpE